LWKIVWRVIMAKKVIQVPMDENLLNALNATSKRRGQPRSEFIREACQRYLRQTEYEQMDEVYKEGYERLPEEPLAGEAQTVLAGQVLPEESW
jgi:metal-responsive CopG/Arc/MetJ family transcriptional regulator